MSPRFPQFLIRTRLMVYPVILRPEANSGGFEIVRFSLCSCIFTVNLLQSSHQVLDSLVSYRGLLVKMYPGLTLLELLYIKNPLGFLRNILVLFLNTRVCRWGLLEMQAVRPHPQDLQDQTHVFSRIPGDRSANFYSSCRHPEIPQISTMEGLTLEMLLRKNLK